MPARNPRRAIERCSGCGEMLPCSHCAPADDALDWFNLWSTRIAVVALVAVWAIYLETFL